MIIFRILFFYIDGLLAQRITLNLGWFLSFNLPGKEDPASSYATAGVAIRVIEPCQLTPPCQGIRGEGSPLLRTLIQYSLHRVLGSLANSCSHSPKNVLVIGPDVVRLRSKELANHFALAR